MILICRGADFSANKIGTVNVKQATTIAISGSSSYTGMATQLTATAVFYDGTTGTISPTWVVTSGTMYASIDGNGLLTIKPGAASSAVTVMAEYDGKTATHKIFVTFSAAGEYIIDVSDFETNCGIANSIQSDGKASSPDNGVYSCIIPCSSGSKLTISYESITVNGTTYSPNFKLFGFNEQAYSTDSNATHARVNRIWHSDTGTYAYSATIFDGFASGATQRIPTMPLTIPLQWDETLQVAKNTNIPYICICVRFVDANLVKLTNLANYAEDIDLTYTIED